ncbi:MAG: MATE family efflux transporter [Verrucomicrobia bacterium]|nr:MATE family efflux transporter [Verrucomicrobiota bacterium]
MSEPLPSSSEPVQPPTSFWRAVGLALKGAHFDYTAVPLDRAVLLLAVPMVLEMIMESLFAVVDVFWVSRLGKNAVAVIGVTETLMSLVYAVAIGISFAATAIVARRIGEKDPKAAAEAAGQIILLGFVVSGILGAVLSWFAADILRLMGTGEEIVALGTRFAQLMLGGNATVFLIFLINAIFRGAGDATIAMRTLWLANALNIALGPCFIFGWGPFPELGVTGAAVATNIGRGLGVCYQVWHLTARPGRVRLHLADFRPRWDLLADILRTSASGVAQLFISTTSWVGLVKILALFGSTVLAGYTIAIRVIIFALMPAWGLANAGATLVGQNLGAAKPERAEQAVRMATKYNMLFLGLVGLVFIAAAGPIVSLFTDEPEVHAHAVRALWVVSLAFPLYAAGMCLEATFNGAGDTWTPTRLNFFCFWLGQVPLAWVLAVPGGLGPSGVFIAVPASYVALSAWAWVLFRRGEWKTKQV